MSKTTWFLLSSGLGTATPSLTSYSTKVRPRAKATVKGQEAYPAHFGAMARVEMYNTTTGSEIGG